MLQIPLFGPETPELLAFGGGVDSSAILAMHLNRTRAAAFLGITRDALDSALPYFHAVVFSDPGAEFPETYRNVDYAAAQVQARSNRTRFVVVRKDGENIIQWLERLGNLPVLPGGSHVCSLKFKGEVLKKWAMAEYGRTARVTWSIGIEADEGTVRSALNQRRKRLIVSCIPCNASIWTARGVSACWPILVGHPCGNLHAFSVHS